MNASDFRQSLRDAKSNYGEQLKKEFFQNKDYLRLTSKAEARVLREVAKTGKALLTFNIVWPTPAAKALSLLGAVCRYWNERDMLIGRAGNRIALYDRSVDYSDVSKALGKGDLS